jgi:hypothetical protein
MEKLTLSAQVGYSVFTPEDRGVLTRFGAISFKFEESDLKDPAAFVEKIRNLISESREGKYFCGYNFATHAKFKAREDQLAVTPADSGCE